MKTYGFLRTAIAGNRPLFDDDRATLRAKRDIERFHESRHVRCSPVAGFSRLITRTRDALSIFKTVDR